MRDHRVSRAYWRLCEDQGSFALPTIIAVLGSFLLLQVFFSALSVDPTVRPGEYFLNLWLMLVFGASYVVWTALRGRGVVDPAASGGFVLAAFGLWARLGVHLFLYAASETYGSTSVREESADGSLRFLIGALKYGGLLAFVVGLALVAWGSLPSRRPDRAARARSGSPPAAGPEGPAPRAGGPPS